MEIIYTVVLVILAITAISDLFVGVTNDAVNFLNSAIGSKAAPMKIILAVASAGIIVGTLTSSGMMEVARSGVLNPEMFTFREVMMLYLAVMLCDIVLLDIYNSLGLPTSTTVSLLFGLMGATVAVSVAKVAGDPSLTMADIGGFINSARASTMVSAILASVAISLAAGSLVMWISRLIFSFRYSRTFRLFGAVWCGVAVTAITYFILIKGLKAPLAGTAFMEFIHSMGTWAPVFIWMFWSIVLLGLQLLRVNILKVSILFGTFSLALAFAGNDLVNFVGVPIAGLDSWKMAYETGNMEMSMGGLRDGVAPNFLILVGAGLVMVLTLWFSKKATHVTETEIRLASAKEGEEKYGSSMFSRAIVRASVAMNNGYKWVVPARGQEWINRRFEPLGQAERGNTHFDLIRATVNLIVASMLIAFGTSLGLPLSTTYVTFMVAMGTSLADRAWGRETAVYRISGVVTVIMGWFVTGLGAFVIAFTIGMALMYGKTVAIVVISALALFLIAHSNLKAKKKDVNAEPVESGLPDLSSDSKELSEQTAGEVTEVMGRVTKIYSATMLATMKESRKTLRRLSKESSDLFYHYRERKYAIMPSLQKMQAGDIEAIYYYVQVVDFLAELTKALMHITRPAFEHIENNHKGFSKDQARDLVEVNDEMGRFYDKIYEMIRTEDFSDTEGITAMRDKVLETIAEAIRRQLRRLKTGEGGTTKTSMLLLGILTETKTMVLQSNNLLKSRKHFAVNEQTVSI